MAQSYHITQLPWYLYFEALLYVYYEESVLYKIMKRLWSGL